MTIVEDQIVLQEVPVCSIQPSVHIQRKHVDDNAYFCSEIYSSPLWKFKEVLDLDCHGLSRVEGRESVTIHGEKQLEVRADITLHSILSTGRSLIVTDLHARHHSLILCSVYSTS
jgi:hypothetical protein